MPIIAVINRSSAPDIDVAFAVAAVDLQIRRDFLPLFPRFAYQPVVFFADVKDLPVASGVVMIASIVDNSDSPGAAAYHGFLGVPYIKIARSLGEISVLLSHEVIEAYGNPECLERRTLPSGTQVAYELCDAVQGWEYRIEVTLLDERRVLHVSAFVTDAWFGVGSGPTYFCPGYDDDLAVGEVASEGYIPTVNTMGVWSRLFGDEVDHVAIAVKDIDGISRFGRIRKVAA